MSTQKEQKYINLEVLKEISEGNNDLMRDLIGLFSKQVPVFIEQMETYLSNNEFELLGKLAHKIKNSVAMMGIEVLVSDMKKLEQLTQSNDNADKIKNKVAKFKQISSEALAELKEIDL
ncbi:MAG: Hpt domain-containing protein [Bacteroidales bacterium]|nr:Hpt domain-containing protein [Bacteroidales bacterium]HPD94607.1 Hpt domain-containing protein [Tenuifilaceae bacterium]HRX31907.1 Hpt domain-containing protein [Tenuifilaceae bacterium]